MSDYIVPHNRPTFSLEKSDKILRFKKPIVKVSRIVQS